MKTPAKRRSIAPALLIISTCLGFISTYAIAQDTAIEFVKVFHMYCVEPRGKASLIDKLVVVGGWTALPSEMVAAGASPDARNPRGFELDKNGSKYLLNYSDSGGCGILSQGSTAQQLQNVLQGRYKFSNVSSSQEGFQAMKMLQFSPDSWYAGSVIVIGYIPDGDRTVVNLAFVPAHRVDGIR